MNARIDAAALASSLRRLERPPPGELLETSITRLLVACRELFDVAGAGLMLADRDGTLRYFLAMEPASRVLEAAQISTGEGPCVDTYLLDQVVITDDVTTDPRWPSLAPLIADQGLGAVIGVPVHLSGTAVGSLDVYADRAQPWDESTRQGLVRFGEVADSMLAAATAAEQAGELAQQLQYAVDYRSVIERAVGYLMARDRLSETDAFDRLRRAARGSRRKITDVARALLESGRLPGETAGRRA
ncbi:GAF and ANTAR domain-containing protein [Nakamurella leprariae]|uniref:GAF and ANTAR domain-containing protein n=1 Tax=Nakamurella leprariae TaxID=2803911 RepID=A0A938Y9C4_9ACTN|nr:GAF and ANTAR domain-containing protein [Nakamurella leprariae]MBM9466352.1 GAF and ANTAR domain-containing protein [Nakamurella leprariae]